GGKGIAARLFHDPRWRNWFAADVRLLGFFGRCGGDVCLMKVVLGSRSPQRRELMGWLVDERDLLAVPPECSDELSFHGLDRDDAIADQLGEIVQQKFDDVAGQVRNLPQPGGQQVCIVCADTVVVAQSGDGKVVLGQPDEVGGEDQLRQWMADYLSGQAHEVWTCFQAGVPAESDRMPVRRETVKTTVWLEELTPQFVDWYISTGEYRGKAGGYAIQGLASVFVRQVQGSLTNVIGLPLMELHRALTTFGIPLRNGAGIWLRKDGDR
ncbi:MAG: Maf family protein, partial [Planctomycetaceae bacterium]